MLKLPSLARKYLRLPFAVAAAVAIPRATWNPAPATFAARQDASTASSADARAAGSMFAVAPANPFDSS
jgi:hypothetical protein